MLTIMQALKKIKQLDRKIEKNQERIGKWCSYIGPIEEPQYDTNKLIQSVNDMLVEKARLQHALHLANATELLEFKGKKFTPDELLILRTMVIPARIETLKLQRRKNLPFNMNSEEILGLPIDKGPRIVLQYDPNSRDREIDGLENDLDNIDQVLDEANVTLDITKYLEL